MILQDQLKNAAVIAPKVSILIPVYNDEKYLDHCVKSILSQDMQNFEAIFLLNGCTDNSEKVLQAYDDERIKVYSVEKNISAGPALVYLMAKASGEYIKPFSADDALLPGAISSLVSCFQEDQDIDLAFAYSVTMNECGKVSHENIIFSKGFDTPAELLRYILEYGNPFSYPTAMVKASACHDMLCDLRYHLVFDLLMWISLIFSGHRYKVLEKPVALYRLRARQGNTISYTNHSIISKHCFEYEMLMEHIPDIITPELYTHFVSYFNANSTKAVEPGRVLSRDDFKACYAYFLYNSTFKNTFSINLKSKVGLRMLFRLMDSDRSRDRLEQYFNFDIFDLRAITDTYYADIKISGRKKYINKFVEYVRSYGLFYAIKRTFYFFIRY